MKRAGLSVLALLGAGVAMPLMAQTFVGPKYRDGVLGRSDPRDVEGHYYQEYSIEVAAGQRLRIEAQGQPTRGIDPIVEIYAPGSSRPDASDDDGGSGTSSRLIYVAPRSGTYRVRVRAFMDSPGGYFLQMAEDLPVVPPTPTPQPPTPTPRR